MAAKVIPYPRRAETVQRLEAIDRAGRTNVALLEHRLEQERLGLLVEMARERIARSLRSAEVRSNARSRATEAFCLAEIDRLFLRIDHRGNGIPVGGNGLSPPGERSP